MPSRGIILLVEDNRVNRRSSAAADCNTPSACMDLHLPGLDGFATTREWRQREGEAVRTAVIALTGLAEDEGCEANLAAGFDWHRSKPLTLGALEEVLEQWVGVGGRE